VKCTRRKVAVLGLSLGDAYRTWVVRRRVRPDAHRLSPTSQIGLYPGEDIAGYTETTTQALEQYGMVNGIESCAQIE